MAERPDATPAMAAIQVPAWVVTGADDAIILPSESEKMARMIPGARLEILAGAGHLVAFERLDAFNRTLEEWIT